MEINKMTNKNNLVKNFIFDDNIQNTFSEINNNLLNFNILEITGMGNQEIKHSNILGWLFDDVEHNLEYEILDSFLKKIIVENDNDNAKQKTLEKLQSYIYLAENKKNITIYREKENIDLLIIDEANKVLFTIENKIFASERLAGDDGGQLKKYENTINAKYSNDYKKYFIFLTIDLNEPSNDTWLKASHSMITETLNEILKNKKDISLKTQIIFESYIDILKRNGIVEDKDLKKLCLQIWKNPNYKKALEILNNYKPDIFNTISEYLQSRLQKDFNELVELDDSNKSLIRFADKAWTSKEQKNGKGWTSGKNVLLYEFQNGTFGLKLKLIIGPTENENFRRKLFNIANDNKAKPFSLGNNLSTKWNQIWSKTIINKKYINDKSFEELQKIIDNELKKFFSPEGEFKTISNIINKNIL